MRRSITTEALQQRMVITLFMDLFTELPIFAKSTTRNSKHIDNVTFFKVISPEKVLTVRGFHYKRPDIYEMSTIDNSVRFSAVGVDDFTKEMERDCYEPSTKHEFETALQAVLNIEQVGATEMKT